MPGTGSSATSLVRASPFHPSILSNHSRFLRNHLADHLRSSSSFRRYAFIQAVRRSNTPGCFAGYSVLATTYRLAKGLSKLDEVREIQLVVIVEV